MSGKKMLFIHNDVVAQVLVMEDAIDCLEKAFRQLVEGTATHRPRCDMYAPSSTVEDGYYRWGTMEGYNDGIFAIRMKSDVMTWPQDEAGNWTEEKYCVEPGTYCGLVFLMSTDNGEPLALMNDGIIQHAPIHIPSACSAPAAWRELSSRRFAVSGTSAR
jgi:alanine dehydrogenase